VLALVVVKALAESPWGVFTVAATIPIAMFMGGYLRFWRIGKVVEATVIGIVLLLLAVWGGKFVHASAEWAPRFQLAAEPLAWAVIVYGLAASVLPVWLLLAPRDYLSTFMKLGTIFALAFGIFIVLPDLQMPGDHKIHRRLRPCRRRKALPVLLHHDRLRRDLWFSHAHRQRHHAEDHHARKPHPLDRLRCHVPRIAGGHHGPDRGLHARTRRLPEHEHERRTRGDRRPGKRTRLPRDRRADGHACADHRRAHALRAHRRRNHARVGMANIFSKVVGGRGLDLWYHFAIMFEALFILTTIDAGTRVGATCSRTSSALSGSPWRHKEARPEPSASLLLVAAWGYFLLQGVRDPLGGINSLWPLFGIANQLPRRDRLCLAVTIILKCSSASAHQPPRCSSATQADRPMR
jgi:carbon starvation protein